MARKRPAFSTTARNPDVVVRILVIDIERLDGIGAVQLGDRAEIQRLHFVHERIHALGECFLLVAEAGKFVVGPDRRS